MAGLGSGLQICNGSSDVISKRQIRALETELEGYGDIRPESFGHDIKTVGRSEFEFDYESNEPALAVISTKPLSRRRVLVDGHSEVELLNYGPLFAVVPSAGEHRVSVTTASSVVTPGVIGFWAIAVAATLYLLRSLWLWSSAPPSPSGGSRDAVRWWIFAPPFVREFAVPGGTPSVCEPRTGRRLDVKTREGS